MLRQGLRTIVNGHPGLEVVGEARDGLEAIELTRTLSPAVVVMDVNMPRCDDVVATKRIKEEIKNRGTLHAQLARYRGTHEASGSVWVFTKESAGVQLCRAIVEAALSRPSGASGEGRDVSCGPS